MLTPENRQSGNPNTIHATVSDALLRELTRIHPEIRVTPELSLADVMFNAGQQSVIQTMRALRERAAREAQNV